MIRMGIILLTLLVSCKSETGSSKNINKYTKLFQSADSISISFNYRDSEDASRISSVHKKDKSLINTIGEMFHKNEKDCACKTVGYIDVYVKDTIALNIEIGQPAATSSIELEFLKVREADKFVCYRLSDMLSQYLAEYRELMK